MIWRGTSNIWDKVYPASRPTNSQYNKTHINRRWLEKSISEKDFKIHFLSYKLLEAYFSTDNLICLYIFQATKQYEMDVIVSC